MPRGGRATTRCRPAGPWRGRPGSRFSSARCGSACHAPPWIWCSRARIVLSEGQRAAAAGGLLLRIDHADRRSVRRWRAARRLRRRHRAPAGGADRGRRGSPRRIRDIAEREATRIAAPASRRCGPRWPCGRRAPRCSSTSTSRRRSA